MKIQWLGHSCFAISLAEGKTIITDPCHPKVGYPAPGVAANAVTV